MLSSYINTTHQIVASDSSTHRIFECISRAETGTPLPWLDDSAILLFSSYTLMIQSLSKEVRLATRIAVVDSQTSKGLINLYDKTPSVLERASRAAEEIRRIYREHTVIIQPMALEDHWFLITYSDNTFRVYDSLRNGVSERAMAELDTAIFGPNSMKKREFASPSVFQKSYWECGYFVCSLIRDILCNYSEDESQQIEYPADVDIRRYADQRHCHIIAKDILNAYNKCRSFFLH